MLLNILPTQSVVSILFLQLIISNNAIAAAINGLIILPTVKHFDASCIAKEHSFFPLKI